MAVYGARVGEDVLAWLVLFKWVLLRMRVGRGLGLWVFGGVTMCGFPSRVTMVLRGIKDTGLAIDLQRDRTSMLNLRTGVTRGGHEITCNG